MIDSTRKVMRFHNSKNILLRSILLFLPGASFGTEFLVTESSDDGTGLTDGSLSQAILFSNTNPGQDTITLTNDVLMTGVMKRLVDSDITFQNDGVRRSINGQNQFRQLFIKSGQVNISGLNLVNGFVQGGAGFGSGAGMGGSVFIYDGQVSINDLSIENSRALGGMLIQSYQGYPGGGGIFGNNSNSGGGGGLFASAADSNGAYGGYGYYQTLENSFGTGGSYGFDVGENGGFGGGGGAAYLGAAGAGGFGGAGGTGYEGEGGSGGFGGGAGGSFYGSGSGSAGFGGSGFSGAGLGGAVFIRSGRLNLSKVSLIGNSASADGTASGLGGGLFVLHSLSNTNSNNQGMPDQLPEVRACELELLNNTASTDAGTPSNNDDVFDLAQVINVDTNQPVDTKCVSDLIFKDGFNNQ